MTHEESGNTVTLVEEFDSMLEQEEKSMPTNNITCEHLLATFSQHVAVSKIQEQEFLSNEHKGQHSSSSSKSVNYIINNKNCSKIT